MAILGKEAFVHKVLKVLNKSQLEDLYALMNIKNPQSDFHLSSDAFETGVKFVSLYLDDDKRTVQNGYLCKTSSICGFFGYFGDNENMSEIDIDVADRTVKFVHEGLDTEEFHREVADLLALNGGDEGYNIIASEDIVLESPNPSWQVPKLTKDEVDEAVAILFAGKSVTITNADEEVTFVATLGDVSTGRADLLLSYYHLGYVDYQVTANDGVSITGYESAGGPTFIRNNLVGSDYVTIDYGESGTAQEGKLVVNLDKDVLDAIKPQSVASSNISIDVTDGGTVITIAGGIIPGDKHVHLMFELEGSGIHYGGDCILHPDTSATGSQNECFVMGRIDVNGSVKDYIANLAKDGTVIINIVNATISDITESNIKVHYTIYID